jgi:iron complex outermembrane receptor protein
MRIPLRGWLLASAACFVIATPAFAADDDTGAPGAPIRNSDDIVVTATKVNKETPITASVHTTEPQAIVSRSIIEDSVPATADFSDVILLTPGASGNSNGGGPGLSESKTTLRGFQDGQFNITYDGVPFGDSNDPTHHSTAYFPDGTYERIIVDRGPGGATDLGQSSYGGNIHLVSRELADKPFVEGQLTYGSYQTLLGRLTLNSGAIDSLDGLKLIAIGEWKQSDTALTGSDAWFGNIFVKAEKPLGENAKFSILSSYNQDLYHQSDNNGVSCTGKVLAAAPGGTYPDTSGDSCLANSQVGIYGKGYGLTDFALSEFANSPWAASRREFNWTNKTTDFEIARLQWNVTPNLNFDNKFYSYFYKNFTVSAEDTTTPCTGVLTQTTCGGMSTKLMGAGLGGGGGASVAGDIPGYTKVNQYRNFGDILQLTWTTEPGVLKVGAWFEHSGSHRYRYDYDLTKGFASGALADGHFDFAGMAQVYNYKETDAAYQTMLNGQYVPAYIKYDERTSWDQIQGFGEFELHLLDDNLKITPGIKIQDFTRRIDTPIAAQTTRVGIQAKDSYKPTLPYFTVNYLIRPNLSTYFQYAKGFLIPSLSGSLESQIPGTGGTLQCQPGVSCNLQPTRTKNFQAGFVYAGDRLNIDADAYYIEASNSTSVDPSTGIATQTSSPAHYKGVECQVSYVLLPGLTAIANGSLMSSKDTASGLWLAQAPNYTALLGAVYRSGRFKLSYLHKFTGRQYADSPAVTATATATTFACNNTNCTAGQLARIAPYSLGILSGAVRVGPAWLSLTVYNLFNDTSTTKIGSPTKSTPLYFFQPGRSYQAQVKFRF